MHNKEESESIQLIQSSQIKNLSLTVNSLQKELKTIKQQKTFTFESPQKHKISVTLKDNESDIDHQCITDHEYVKLKHDLKNMKKLFYECLSYLYKSLLMDQNIDFDITNID